jgi:chromosome segregation ATPase
MHFSCLQTAFTSKRECPICRAAYPQFSVKIQKLFFDCSRSAADTLDGSITVDSAELEELTGKVQEKSRHIAFLEAAILSEKQANSGLAAELGKARQEHDAARRELAAAEKRLRGLDQDYQQNRRQCVDLELEVKQLREREKRLRVQLSVLQYSKEEERVALARKDAPREELLALITSLKRQNAELTLRAQKLEQDVMMSEERSGSVAQLLSSIDRGARMETGVATAAALQGSSARKRARVQSAVATYVQSLAPQGRSERGAAVADDDAAGCFSALRLAKQCAPLASR